jgi:predicted lipid-binding transport protein (Tim44 family)
LNAELLLYALVAAGLVFWLRSVLGTRHGEERERPNPFTAPPEGSVEAGDNPISIADNGLGLPLPEKPILPRNVSITGDAADRGLFEIAKADRDFDLAQFAQGAQDAFVIIVEAFAHGDRDTLRNLLLPNVYNAFEAALNDREAKKEIVSTEIHSVRKAEILDAKIEGRDAFITIRFIADETCVVRDRDNIIVSGDPERITEMNDIWTFTRALKSRDPRWLLQETRDGDVQETHRTPVPDSFTV